MPPGDPPAHTRTVEDLLALVERLRDPGGCPWDREQTHESLKPYLLEETYEALEAIDSGSDTRLAEELGDVLMQVVFHAEIADREGRFTINDVVQGIKEKLIRRHPHVFGNVTVDGSDEVLRNWEEIKRSEKRGKKDGGSVLDGLPKDLPALIKARRLLKKLIGDK